MNEVGQIHNPREDYEDLWKKYSLSIKKFRSCLNCHKIAILTVFLKNTDNSNQMVVMENNIFDSTSNEWIDIDKRIGIIFKKFQFDLKLNKETINYSMQLFENIKTKDPFNEESEYLLVAVCIFTVSRLDDQPSSPSEVAKVFRLKESHLVGVYKLLMKAFEENLKNQRQTSN